MNDDDARHRPGPSLSSVSTGSCQHKPVEWKPAMWIGWIGLAASMFGGFVHLLGWYHYYKSYLDLDWRSRNDANQDAARATAVAGRARLNCWRRWAMGASSRAS